ncbi:MAG: HlyD family efflux transporter periplasmic adaptor subunit [Alphaproteobacteria bacterium]|nr:HlyD family efflux transporter periplasmic adaptor subunit [Alphaproteobacteria bacterium]
MSDRLRALVQGTAEPAAQAVSGSDGQDRRIAPKPLWRRYALPGIAMILAAAGAVWLLAGQGGKVYRAPIDQLTIATVGEGPFEDYIAVRGAVAPFTTAYLTTDQGGTVKQVLVEDGVMVKRGQALIVLSNPALQLQVAAQQLTFEQTRFKYQQDLLNIEHQISKLKNDLARDKILLDGNAIAPSTYKQEQEEYEYYVKLRAATVASRAVEQQVRATQLTGATPVEGRATDITNAGVEALTIRAPMDGQLTALDAEVGQSKAIGAVLGQVNSADKFKLTAQVDEFYLGHVAAGQDTMFNIDGRDYRARVAKVYPQVTSGTFKTDFYFEGAAPAGIHVGQAVDLKVELGGAQRAVMLPNGPFYQDTGGNWVFVVTPDGKSAIRRNVRLGRRNPEFVEVVDGLKPGEKVIVSGYEAFQKMDRVEFTAGRGMEQ